MCINYKDFTENLFQIAFKIILKYIKNIKIYKKYKKNNNI